MAGSVDKANNFKPIKSVAETEQHLKAGLENNLKKHEAIGASENAAVYQAVKDTYLAAGKNADLVQQAIDGLEKMGAASPLHLFNHDGSDIGDEAAQLTDDLRFVQEGVEQDRAEVLAGKENPELFAQDVEQAKFLLHSNIDSGASIGDAIRDTYAVVDSKVAIDRAIDTFGDSTLADALEMELDSAVQAERVSEERDGEVVGEDEPSDEPGTEGSTPAESVPEPGPTPVE
jgi:hypothetical protein